MHPIEDLSVQVHCDLFQHLSFRNTHFAAFGCTPDRRTGGYPSPVPLGHCKD